jgi:hypothetical protein
MAPEQIRTGAERDQLWASLRLLRQDIDVLAGGVRTNSERERQVIAVLARVIAAELDFRAADGDCAETI